MNYPQQAAGYRQTLIIFLKAVTPEMFLSGVQSEFAYSR
jgi:hypothetical protein